LSDHINAPTHLLLRNVPRILEALIMLVVSILLRLLLLRKVSLVLRRIWKKSGSFILESCNGRPDEASLRYGVCTPEVIVVPRP
jgi:hypothetical protein